MMNFCWALVIITAVIGPFSNGAEDRTALSRDVLDYPVTQEDRRHLPGPSSGSNVATVGGQDLTPWFGDELNLTLNTGPICDAIPDDASITWTHRVRNKNNWHDGWWSWIELYEGRFTCSDSGLYMDGDCDPDLTQLRATCYVEFTGVRMSSSWRVAVRNPQHDGHFVIIEAGHLNATVDVLYAVLEIDRDRTDNHLYINDVDPQLPDIHELIFDRPTIALYDQKIDTSDEPFQELVRGALYELVDFFLMNPFLDRMEEAFLEAENKTSEAFPPE